MVQTCSVEPKYGKSDAFKKEVNEVGVHVQELENLLKSLRAEHAEVESRLEGLKNRNSPHPSMRKQMSENSSITESPMLNSMNRNNRDRQNALNQSQKSDRSSINLSIASSSDHSGGSNYYPNGAGVVSSGNIPPPPPGMPNYNTTQYDTPQGIYQDM